MNSFFSEVPYDLRFTFEGLIQLQNYIDVEQFQDGITFWGDNGFRNRECFYSFWFIVRNLQISTFVNFVAPQHGFNLCDTHFGNGKQMMRQQHRHKLIQFDCLAISSIFTKEGLTIFELLYCTKELYFIEKTQVLFEISLIPRPPTLLRFGRILQEQMQET